MGLSSLERFFLFSFCCLLSVSANAQNAPKIGDILHEPSARTLVSGSKIYTLLVTQFAYPNANYPVIKDTIETLKQLFGPENLKVEVYSGETQDIHNADLVLSSAGTYARMKMIGAKDLATVVSNGNPDPNHSEGSVFIALSSRQDISDIASLKNKTLATTGPNAFSGYHVALGELALQGYNPDSFFLERISTGHDMRNVLSYLREGRADVGIVRTCFLEELAGMGYKVNDIKIIGGKDSSNAHFKCKTSTDLYPNWTIFATPQLSASDARKVVITLLSMPQREGVPHWGIVSDFSSTDNLYKTLKLGPYTYLRNWTWERIRKEYGFYLLLIPLVFVGLLAHYFRESYLLNKRTVQLRNALRRRRESERKARSAQTKLQLLEKSGAVGQISSIVAHELRQPLATIMNYAHALQRQLEMPKADVDLISDGLTKMERQAQKANRIVTKVREYAKGRAPRRKDLNINELLTNSVKVINDSKLSAVPVILEKVPTQNIFVNCDPLEVELCFVNIMKNALEVSHLGDEVRVELTLQKDSRGRQMATISVRDNGAKLKEEELLKLKEPLQSDKAEGLGLGLAIVRRIVANHGGSLEFRANSGNGLSVVISLPALGRK